MSRDVHELAYETAIRALDQQERRLEELRSRAGTFLAAASIALPLLSPTATGGIGPAPLTIAALLAFTISAAASLYVLVPRREVVLAASPMSIYERLEGDETSAAHRQLVRDLHAHRRRNDQVTRKLTEACQGAGIFLAIETFLLVALRSGDII